MPDCKGGTIERAGADASAGVEAIWWSDNWCFFV